LSEDAVRDSFDGALEPKHAAKKQTDPKETPLALFVHFSQKKQYT